jgi:hypothetical protein
LLGLGLIAAFEWRDKSVRTERDIELWLKLPVVGIVPEFAVPGETSQSRKQRKLAEKARKRAADREKVSSHKPEKTVSTTPVAQGVAAVNSRSQSGAEVHV